MSSYITKTFMNESNRNLYNSLFSFSGRGSGLSSMNNLLSGSSNLLGEYSMIKGGTYKKLLTAYYDTQKDNSSEETTTNKKPSVATDETSKLVATKSDAKKLGEAVKKLSDSSLYRSKGEDSEGNLEYDKDSIKSALKGYVDAYNSYIDSSSKVNSTAILSKTYSMVRETAGSAESLGEAGIKVGVDNKLSFDEEAFDKASVSQIKSLFSGGGSYGHDISFKASESFGLANSAAYSSTHASSYTYNGSYSMIGTSDMLFNKFM